MVFASWFIRYCHCNFLSGFLSDTAQFLSAMPIKYNNKPIIWRFKLHLTSRFVTSILNTF